MYTGAVEGASNNTFFDSEPGGREAAPDHLAVVQAFVNTREAERGWEELKDTASLRWWLVGRGLLTADEPVEAADVGRAREVREALRALLAANNGTEMDAGTVRALDVAARRAGFTIRFAGDGSAALGPGAGGVDGALGRVLAAVYAGMEEGTWQRLKTCANDGCTWAFYDRSRNHSGRWCSMAICGNRTKTRAYRHRKGD